MKKCDICGNDFILLDKHHIVSKSMGGGNEHSNICRLCPNCHREIHKGVVIIEGWKLSTDGYILMLTEDEKMKDNCWIMGQEKIISTS